MLKIDLNEAKKCFFHRQQMYKYISPSDLAFYFQYSNIFRGIFQSFVPVSDIQTLFSERVFSQISPPKNTIKLNLILPFTFLFAARNISTFWLIFTHEIKVGNIIKISNQSHSDWAFIHLQRLAFNRNRSVHVTWHCEAAVA